MSDPKLISPLLDDFIIGDPMSEHHGVRCCPALRKDTESRYIVKIISVPASQVQLEALLLTGAYSSNEAALAYFKEMAQDLTTEVEVLKKLSAFESFLPYEGCQIVPMDDAVGYDVYLLSPYKRSLERHMQKKPMTQLAAVNLGLDLCASMAMCRRAGFMYVDLKPTNIFVNEKNEFCIGDLGFVSMDSLKYASLPEKYRSPYTPPEISDAMSALNTTVDIYAIGKILYEVYNDGKLPTDGELAGQTPPIYADYEMSQIILRACDPDPARRWQDPLQMGQALVAYMQRNGVNDVPIVPLPEPVIVPTEEESLEEEQVQDTVEQLQEESPAEDVLQELPEEITQSTEDDVLLETDANTVEQEVILPENILESIEESGDGIAVSEEAPEEIICEPEQEPDQVEEDIGDLSFMDHLSDDDTLPQADELEDFHYNELSDDASDILTLADELIAHETPEPVVAPEPIEIPVPAPIEIGDEEELELVDDADLSGDEDEDDIHMSLSEELEAAVIAHERNAVYDDKGYDYVEGDDEDDYDDDEDEDDSDLTITRREREKNPNTGKLIKQIVSVSVTVILAAAIIIGAYYYYDNFYLQTIEDMQIIGSGNQLTIELTTDVDETQLIVECTDTYGTVKSSAVTDGKAVFSNLNPNTLYTIRVSINGFHELVGDIAGSYTTPSQTKIVSFHSIAGSEDGSVILNFTVDGQDSTDWIMEYTADGEESKQQSFTGHMVTITGLTKGKTYTFRITSPNLMYIVGKDTLTFTATSLVMAQDLTITSCNNDGLTAVWTVPEDAEVTNWNVRCYNDNGYDETITTTEPSVTFAGIDPAAAYTVEVTAEGMTVNVRAFVTANSATISNFTASADELTKLVLSWDSSAAVPANGWLLMYTRGENSQQEVIRTDVNQAVLPNPIPGETYFFQLQAADGTTVFEGKFQFTMPAAPAFSGYQVSASKMTFSMCPTPDKEGWTHKDAKNTYTNTFNVGQKASFVVKLSKKYVTSADIITTMYIIRDSQGKIVVASSTAQSWTSMWYQYYCELDVPAMPQDPGDYTMQIYFSGMLAHEQNFTIAE